MSMGKQYRRAILFIASMALVTMTGTAQTAVTEKVYPLNNAGLTTPFWKSSEIRGESVLFVKEKNMAAADGQLLLTPEKIIKVCNSRGDITYEEGKDYQVNGRQLILTANTRISFFERAELYKNKGEKQAIKHLAGNPDVWLFYQERGFPLKQVEVFYTAKESWNGFTPKYAGDKLPVFIKKLQNKQPVNIVLLGDSISAGANASKNIPPYMPPYPDLLRLSLEKTYGGKVNLINLAVAGTTAIGATKQLDKTFAAKPDLVVVAYGMNDTASHHPEIFARDIGGIITAIRAKLPEQEFILVSSSLANPEWNWSPKEQFIPFRNALAGLCGKGIIMADITGLWADIMTRKALL